MNLMGRPPMDFSEMPTGLFTLWLSDIYIKDRYGDVWCISYDARTPNTPIRIELVERTR